MSCEFSGRHSLAIPKSVMRKYPATRSSATALTFLVEDEVLGLDVTMKYVLVVDILQASDETSDEET